MNKVAALLVLLVLQSSQSGATSANKIQQSQEDRELLFFFLKPIFHKKPIHKPKPKPKPKPAPPPPPPPPPPPEEPEPEEPCPPGTFGSDEPNCVKCPAGSVSTTYGQSSCDLCPPRFEPNSDHTDCILKPTPTTTPKPKLEPCPAGFFGKGGDSCTKCPGGSITKFPGRRRCKKCISWKTSNPSRTRCIPGPPCPPAFFGRGGDTCKPCPSGTFAKFPGRRKKCKTCAPNKMPNETQTGCVRKCVPKGWRCSSSKPCCAGSTCKIVAKDFKKCL